MEGAESLTSNLSDLTSDLRTTATKLGTSASNDELLGDTVGETVRKTGMANVIDDIDRIQDDIYQMEPLMKAVEAAVKGQTQLTDAIPVCKPWQDLDLGSELTMSAVENLRDYLLTLQKQVWQLHKLRPQSKIVDSAFLDLSAAEVLLAPISGKGIHSRVNFEEIEKVRQLGHFFDGRVRTSLKGAQSAAFSSVSKESQTDQEMSGTHSPGQLRSKAKGDYGYDYATGSGLLKNAIRVDQDLAEVYLNGNGAKSVGDIIEKTADSFHDALSDVLKYSEPCQLSNF